MISLETPSPAAKKSKFSTLNVTRSRSNLALNKSHTGKCLPVYTTQAPLEVISFFYRLGREANEQKQSMGRVNLADDTPLPEPLRKIWSSRLAMDIGSISLPSTLPISPSHSAGELEDYEVMSNTWNFDDEDESNGTPSFLLKDASDGLLFEQFCSSDEKMDSHNNSECEPININFSNKPSRARANSTDYAYSEANEESRIGVARLKSPTAMRNFLTREQVEDDKLLSIAKDRLNKGRQNHIVSKLMLNVREIRYERQKDNFVKTCLRYNSLFNSPTSRPKASSVSERHMRVGPKDTSSPCKPSLEELKDDQFFLYDDASLSRYV